MNFHAVDVIGVRVEMPSNQPIVLLKEIGGPKYLPIWIGAVELPLHNKALPRQDP